MKLKIYLAGLLIFVIIIYGFYKKKSNSCGNCSNTGYCYKGVCTCYAGYEGDDCGTIICSGNGKYDTDKNCICNDGYEGDNCGSKICSGNGKYDAERNCVCNDGYEGNNCEIKICSGNGKYDANRNCVCNDGYVGDECQKKCPCLNGSKCVEENNGEVTCDCYGTGFQGDTCNEAQPLCSDIVVDGDTSKRIWATGAGGFASDCPKDENTKRVGHGQYYYGIKGSQEESTMCNYLGDKEMWYGLLPCSVCPSTGEPGKYYELECGETSNGVKQCYGPVMASYNFCVWPYSDTVWGEDSPIIVVPSS